MRLEVYCSNHERLAIETTEAKEEGEEVVPGVRYLDSKLVAQQGGLMAGYQHSERMI